MTVWRWIYSLVLLPALAGAELERRVALVYNAQEPASFELAEFYATQRGVPTNQICRVSVRPVETITRREFDEQIRGPVTEFLAGRPGVHYVVLMYGVPLRIENNPQLKAPVEDRPVPAHLQGNQASVESELALVRQPGAAVVGVVANPFFNSRGSFAESGLATQLVLVGRLDAPDPKIVRQMVTDALRVERVGLHGRAYFDIRSTQEPGYRQGDEWIREAYAAFREVGFECELDERPATYGVGDPVTDVAVYAGWYAHHVSGPFTRADFRFQRGAVAYHIHSSSGASLRTRTAYWAGPFLAKGAAATMGNVYEPYLTLTPRVDLFYRRLLSGAVFLEAAYASQPVLSWQTTFVGDPLYRPFGVPMDEQIARLRADGDPDLEWAYLRKVNMLLSVGERAAAEELCREQATALGSAVLWEKCGDLAWADRRGEAALAAYRAALPAGTTELRAIRVTTKLARCYVAGSEFRKALALYEELIAAYPAQANVLELYKQARQLAGQAGDPAREAAWQTRIDEWVAAAAESKRPKRD